MLRIFTTVMAMTLISSSALSLTCEVAFEQDNLAKEALRKTNKFEALTPEAPVLIIKEFEGRKYEVLIGEKMYFSTTRSNSDDSTLVRVKGIFIFEQVPTDGADIWVLRIKGEDHSDFAIGYTGEYVDHANHTVKPAAVELKKKKSDGRTALIGRYRG